MSGLTLDSLVAGRRGFRVGPVSLHAPPGTRVVLLGRNGGGKSTLLKTIAGLLRPVAGVVQADGVDLARARARGRASLVAYLPPPGEVDAPFPARHVAALGRMGRAPWPGDLTAADRRAAEEALERLNLTRLAERPFDRLSTGQRQLVLFARLLVQDARVCLLDEPASGLDPAHRAAVAGAVRALADAGKVVVVATHEPAEAARADVRVLLTDTGVRVEPGGGPLAHERLAELYGAPVDACGACGRPWLEETEERGR